MSKQFYYRAGEESLNGPFKSLSSARAEILARAKECFNESCNCLKRETNVDWFEIVEIFELVSIVQPTVKACLKLEEVTR